MSGPARWPLPIFVALRNVPVTVIGAGTVAERKVSVLLDAGARLTVVAPEATPGILDWAAQGRLELRRRPYRAGDLRGARLAYAATSLPEVNRAVRVEARAEGVWLNAVDQPELCDFITPAIVRRGDLTIAISTDGRAPGVAQRVREELDEHIGPDYEKKLNEAADERPGDSELVFLTGHDCLSRRRPIEWSRYARTSASLVIVIGVHHLDHIARRLLEHGRDPACPVAVIENGTTDGQRTVVAPLVSIADTARAAGIRPPALIVVGEVVKMREKLAVLKPADRTLPGPPQLR